MGEHVRTYNYCLHQSGQTQSYNLPNSNKQYPVRCTGSARSASTKEIDSRLDYPSSFQEMVLLVIAAASLWLL